MKALFILLALILTTTSFAKGVGGTYGVQIVGNNEFIAETEGRFTVKESMSKEEAQKKVFQSAARDLKKHGAAICNRLPNTQGASVKVSGNQDISKTNVDSIQCQSKGAKEICFSVALIQFSCI